MRGNSKRQSLLNSTKQMLSRHFSDSPSYYEVAFNNDSELTGVHIVDDSQTKEQNLVISPFKEVKTGFIVHWRDYDWLTIIVDPLETHWKGTIKKCESTLKWLDAQGLVKETPFTQKFSSTAYPLQDDKIMILSKERRVILVQANDDTKQIKKDRRFIFDERCWKVIGYNGLVEGLLELTLEEDQFHDTLDNIELRIADYYGRVANYKVQILNGSNSSLSLDDSLQLTIRITNNESVVDSPPLLFVSSNESVATVDDKGLITAVSVGEVIINVECNGATSSITLQVTDQRVYNYTLEILGNAEITSGQSQEYQVIFYSNGTPIHDKATFSLKSLDGTPTTLASIKTTTETSCVVTAGKTTGKLLLHAANHNGLITGSKEIKIKSLI